MSSLWLVAWRNEIPRLVPRHPLLKREQKPLPASYEHEQGNPLAKVKALTLGFAVYCVWLCVLVGTFGTLGTWRRRAVPEVAGILGSFTFYFFD